MVWQDFVGGTYAMLIPGDRILKIRKVCQNMGQYLIDLFPKKTLVDEFGVMVGAISTIQFLGKARILIDPTFPEVQLIDISSGDSFAGITLKSRELFNITNAEQYDFIYLIKKNKLIVFLVHKTVESVPCIYYNVNNENTS
jgi:prolyl-tRNA editing enzyme YbaK/EbsC (Cys-tRNA(Pro) deacylase)